MNLDKNQKIAAVSLFGILTFGVVGLFSDNKTIKYTSFALAGVGATSLIYNIKKSNDLKKLNNNQSNTYAKTGLQSTGINYYFHKFTGQLLRDEKK